MKDIELRGASRRDFIKGVLATSAALGLGPTRALEVFDQLGGSALAQAAMTAKNSVNLIGGTGGGSWFQLLFPTPRVIKAFDPSFAYDDPTKATQVTGIDGGRDLYVRKLASGKRLWEDYGTNKLMSVLTCGAPNAHEVAPVASLTSTLPNGVGGSVGLFAGLSAIQTSLKTTVPSIGIKFNNTDPPYGAAAGAPPPSTVADAGSMISLFSSAASQVMTRLMTSSNQAAFDLYYKAFQGLTKTSSIATFSRAFTDAKVAENLLAKNLRTLLQPATGQNATWMGGLPGNEKVSAMADALIVTANAFKLGLTAQVSIPVFQDDPHGAFGSIANVTNVADATANVLQSFLDELAKTADVSNPGKTLADAVIMTIIADTWKDPFTASGWPDGYAANVNWIYVMSQGLIKPGWFGDVRADGSTRFDPATGMLSPNVPEPVMRSGAMAAILYACTGGDKRRVNDFYNASSYDGIINAVLS